MVHSIRWLRLETADILSRPSLSRGAGHVRIAASGSLQSRNLRFRFEII
jgi:hypothetical protein